MSDDYEWDCTLGCGFGSDSAGVVIHHEAEECPRIVPQAYLDGFQAALEAIEVYHPAVSVSWAKDPAVRAAAVERHEARCAKLDSRRSL